MTAHGELLSDPFEQSPTGAALARSGNGFVVVRVPLTMPSPPAGPAALCVLGLLCWRACRAHGCAWWLVVCCVVLFALGDWLLGVFCWVACAGADGWLLVVSDRSQLLGISGTWLDIIFKVLRSP